jgi:hypothetical protein
MSSPDPTPAADIVAMLFSGIHSLCCHHPTDFIVFVWQLNDGHAADRSLLYLLLLTK